MDQKKLEALRDLIGEIGADIAQEKEAAFDLWSWLPSYRERDRNHPRHPEAIDPPSITGLLIEATTMLRWIRSPSLAKVETTLDFCCPCGNCEPPTGEQVEGYLKEYRRQGR